MFQWIKNYIERRKAEKNKYLKTNSGEILEAFKQYNLKPIQGWVVPNDDGCVCALGALYIKITGDWIGEPLKGWKVYRWADKYFGNSEDVVALYRGFDGNKPSEGHNPYYYIGRQAAKKLGVPWL